MDARRNDAAVDPTLDSSPESIIKGRIRRAVAFIEGSTPQMVAETNALLRDRLRIASLLLFAGYFAFLLRGLFFVDGTRTPVPQALFWVHVAMTILTGLVAIRLCMNCQHILKHLRLVELLVFGGSGLFFLLMSWWRLADSARQGYLASIVPLWLLLIFTYALFIPNTFRRAAIVIGLMAAAPIGLVVGLRLWSPDFSRVVISTPGFQGYELEITMIVLLSGAIAVWGVRTIWALRRQAFEAKQLGQYRLKQLLGKGGMGEVYLGEHMLLKRPCAIKLVRPEKAGEAKSVARFEREVQATAKLTHWNTIEIFDYGRADDGTFYYVMEYLPGMNLGQLVEMYGPLPPERVIHLLMQVCDALGEAHQHGLIHRDIKPGNIFSANRGGVYDVVKLLDFGLAKPLTDVADAALTQEGAITGSPLFMSPEQASGDPVDARSDIYALGIVAYYLLTGRVPFAADNPMRLLLAHIQQAPPPITDSHPHVPVDLEAVVMRCLEKSASNRFPDTDSLREALADCAAAGLWSREMARHWWECNGCPKKRALDQAVLQSA